MSKVRTIENKTFGRLNHRVADLWERLIELHFLGQQCKVPLYVDIDKEVGAPEANQVAAYETFTKHLNEVIRATEKAIIKQYVSATGNKTPSAQQVSKAVRLEAVAFPYVCPMPTFGFLFKCDWEVEHGLAVKFEGGQLTEVGLQDILL